VGRLAPTNHRAHGAFDDVGVQVEAAIVEEAGQAGLMIERVTDRLRQRRAAGQSAKQAGQPAVHGLDQGTALLLTLLPAVVGRLAADVGLERIQRADPLEDPGREDSCRRRQIRHPSGD
jgi:hypothetical protein